MSTSDLINEYSTAIGSRRDEIVNELNDAACTRDELAEAWLLGYEGEDEIDLADLEERASYRDLVAEATLAGYEAREN